MIAWVGIHGIVTGTQMSFPLAQVEGEEGNHGNRNIVRLGILSACGKGLITGLVKKFILDNLPPA